MIIESRVHEPIVPLGMFRNTTVTLATIAIIAMGTAMFSGAVFLGQFFQLARGYSLTHAGFMTLPIVLGLFVSSTVSGQIISRWTSKIKPFLVLGSVLLVAALRSLSTIDHATDLIQMGIFLAMMGAGSGSCCRTWFWRAEQHG